MSDDPSRAGLDDARGVQGFRGMVHRRAVSGGDRRPCTSIADRTTVADRGRRPDRDGGCVCNARWSAANQHRRALSPFLIVLVLLTATTLRLNCSRYDLGLRPVRRPCVLALLKTLSPNILLYEFIRRCLIGQEQADTNVQLSTWTQIACLTWMSSFFRPALLGEIV